MGNETSVMDTGLRGVTVSSTRIGDVRGQEGKLIYRGYLIQDLAEKTTFEEIVHLLLYETLPGKEELAGLKARLKKERELPKGIIDALKTCPKDSLPMDILQMGASMLALYDPDAVRVSKNPLQDASSRMAEKLIAKLPSIVCAWERIRNKKEVVPPSPDLDHGANFLFMLTGETPDQEVARFFDTALVLHADHGFNASTFTAREVASTRAHMYASISAAIGSLSGALHGGANSRVMKMLLEIGKPENVESYLEAELSAGNKIMGLGHAVYKVDDPRALILKPMSKTMGEMQGDTRWYEISVALEEAAKKAFKERKNMDIFVNVDYYSASLYYSMGIPVDTYTSVFAVSRVSGWTAHVIEELFPGEGRKPALYRPASKYVGEYCGPEECVFAPIENR